MHTTTSIRAASVGEGLIVQLDGQGEKTLVMPSQDISDDVLATLPKLQAVANSAATKIGRRWKPQRGKNEVGMYELLPGGGKDADVAHALLATADLRCHVNEVLSVLVHRDSDEMEATVQSLGGSRVRGGEMLYQKLLPLESKLKCDADKLSHSALFSVQTVTVRPKFKVKRQSKLRIGFSTCTIRFPNRERAYHLMKTLPKDVHNKVVTESEGTALDGTHDHLAMGWDIRLTNRGEYGSGNHTTRVIAHSYIATVPPSEYGRLHPASFNPSALAKHRKTYSNSDAERVIEVFTNSLQEFQTVIRRRRLGFQSFIDHPKEDEVKTPICTICRKKFSFFRRDHFCRLCGHVVCGECSGMYDVEAPVRCVSKYRCCVACIRRVDACHFDDEDIVPALGPVIVDSDDWDLGIVSLSDTLMEDKQEPSKALESLDRLIHTDSFRSTAISDMSSRPRTSSTTTSTISVLRPTKKEIIQDLNQRLAKHLKKAMDTYRANECPVYDSERDYAFEFDTDITTYPGNPLAPVPDAEKVERRLHYMQTSGVLNDDYDRSALDLLSQVAAKQLGCPIGFVGMVDEKFFHAIGNYQLELSGAIPYDENVCIHTIYAERPMIRKNMQRDMRFAQMPTIRDGGVKFYAGFPVRAPDGTVMATLCAVDVEPHVNIGTKEYATMEMLSELAAELIVPRQSLSY